MPTGRLARFAALVYPLSRVSAYVGMWVDAVAMRGLHLPRMVGWRRLLVGVRNYVIACLHNCRHWAGGGVSSRGVAAALAPVSVFRGLLEGVGDAFAWGAAGREVRVEALGLVVVGVGRPDVAAAPVAFEGVQPAAQQDQLLAADVVDAGTVVAGVAVGLYEPGGAQDRQVFADERLACAEGAGERGRGTWLVRERPHDLLAQPVGQEVERRERRWCGPAVAAGFSYVPVVMHLLWSVFPGSRVSMRVSAGWCWRRVGAFAPVGVPYAAFVQGKEIKPVVSPLARDRAAVCLFRAPINRTFVRRFADWI